MEIGTDDTGPLNEPKTPYQLGYDAGKNGANKNNYNHFIFQDPQNTRHWCLGNMDAKNNKPERDM